jgi:hypothetical protein
MSTFQKIQQSLIVLQAMQLQEIKDLCRIRGCYFQHGKLPAD